MAWEQPEPEKPGTRELTLVESPYGFAWGCEACEWFHPLPSFIPEGESPIKIVQLAFDEHDLRLVSEQCSRPRRVCKSVLVAWGCGQAEKSPSYDLSCGKVAALSPAERRGLN